MIADFAGLCTYNDLLGRPLLALMDLALIQHNRSEVSGRAGSAMVAHGKPTPTQGNPHPCSTRRAATP